MGEEDSEKEIDGSKVWFLRVCINSARCCRFGSTRAFDEICCVHFTCNSKNVAMERSVDECLDS